MNRNKRLELFNRFRVSGHALGFWPQSLKWEPSCSEFKTAPQEKLFSGFFFSGHTFIDFTDKLKSFDSLNGALHVSRL